MSEQKKDLSDGDSLDKAPTSNELSEQGELTETDDSIGRLSLEDSKPSPLEKKVTSIQKTSAYLSNSSVAACSDSSNDSLSRFAAIHQEEVVSEVASKSPRVSRAAAAKKPAPCELDDMTNDHHDSLSRFAALQQTSVANRKDQMGSDSSHTPARLPPQPSTSTEILLEKPRRGRSESQFSESDASLSSVPRPGAIRVTRSTSVENAAAQLELPCQNDSAETSRTDEMEGVLEDIEEGVCPEPHSDASGRTSEETLLDEGPHPPTLVEARLVEDDPKVYVGEEVSLEPISRQRDPRKTVLISISLVLLLAIAIVVLAVKLAGSDSNEAMDSLRANNPTLVPTAAFLDGVWSKQSELYGQEEYEGFGSNVKLSEDGNIMAVSSVFAQGYRGGVRVFRWAGEWVQMGNTIVGKEPEAMVAASLRLDMSGDGSVIALSSKKTYESAGHVIVYQWNPLNETWVQRGQTFIGEQPGDQLGFSVSLSNTGNALAICTALQSSAPWSSPGELRIYDFDETDNHWSQRGEPIHGQTDFDFVGYVNVLSGDGMVIAFIAPNAGSDRPESAEGQVRVYAWTDSGWTQRGESIQGSGLGSDPISLSADGETLAMSISNPDLLTPGQWQVLHWNASENKWDQVGDKTEHDTERLSFTMSLSLDGKRISVATYSLTATEYIAVYDLVDDEWQQRGQRISGMNQTQSYARILVMSGDGSTLAISDPQAEFLSPSGTGSEVGRVDVYTLQDSN